MLDKDTIIALVTPDGRGAIAVIRISGPQAFFIIDSIFQALDKSKKMIDQASHTLHIGYILDKDRLLDQVLVALFKTPNSYTGEDVIEVSCHGSSYIVRVIIQLIIQKGARIASAGEFTMRAFLNGKIDLSQAEAVADLIASEAEADHTLAMHQLRGSVSDKVKSLRSDFINFASLVELNLDFSEEDIDFADKYDLLKLLENIEKNIKLLLDSFTLGSAIKQGIYVAIIGAPNVGKSTLLNTLLQEDRAIISDIPGTTRDVIEGQIIINGIRFRFIDTAGIRQTKNEIESLGIQKTIEKVKQAQVILYVFDRVNFNKKEFLKEFKRFSKSYIDKDKTLFLIANKSDLFTESFSQNGFYETIFSISAKKKEGIDKLLEALSNLVNYKPLGNRTMITHSRHYNSLHGTLKAIHAIKEAINGNISGDLFSIDIRNALDYLGEISGEISNEELRGNIFSKFCIGK